MMMSGIALILSAHAEEPSKEVGGLFEGMMSSIAKQDFPGFRSQGNATFKKAITESAFSSVCSQLTPLLKDGFEAKFLTSLTQQGYEVYLWKVAPKIGKNQFVAKLVVENGKVAGFWIN